MSLLGKHGIGNFIAGLLAAVTLGAAAAVPAAADEPVYTVAKYPVDAVAGNAVAAKQKALADGQKAAFRSLLKRLVPVTSYGQLNRVMDAEASNLIDSVSVRQEQTSATQYIASLDFSFQADAVRDLLERERVPFTDEQAPKVTVVPIYAAPAPGQGPVPAALSLPRGTAMWRDVWAGLDLEHALTPVVIGEVKPELTSEVIQKLINGDGTALPALSKAYGSSLVLLAVAQPDLAKERLNVSLTGRDAAGAFVLNRSYRMSLDDAAYTSELAAVVSLGIIEGRWKETEVSHRTGPMVGYGAGASTQVQLLVEFHSMRQWQQMRDWIARLPGIEGIQVGGLTARSADVVADYPGGPEGLARALAAHGLDVRQIGNGTLQVRPAL